MKQIALYILFTLSAICLQAKAETLDTSTAIFEPRFRTLKTESSSDFFAQPIIRLGSSDKIVISFDELTEDVSYLRFRLIHCNADWRPSRLIESEYIDGFNDIKIDDYAYSSNTFIHFVNYRIEIPSEQCMPIVSGNYLLQIYDEEDPNTTLLQTRFYVEQSLTDISGEASARTDKGINSYWQQLNFVVDPGQYTIRDPFTELTAIVEQNNRTDNAVAIIHPLRLQGNKIVYEHNPKLIFPASNEFRRFETVRATYPGMHVDSTRYMGRNYHAYLAIDEPRTDSEYLYDSTQFGRFKIDEYNSSDPDLGADYITVHFSLDCPYYPDAEIYVDGEFTGHKFSPANRMNYDSETRLYTTQILLKQGSYNYQYIALPKGSNRGDASRIEGDKYETVNEYTIRLYQRTPTARADKLIGHATIYSKP